jgi:feruloyl esterase
MNVFNLAHSAEVNSKKNHPKRTIADVCDSLKNADIKNVNVISVENVLAGAFEFPVNSDRPGPMKGDFLFAPFNWTGKFKKGTNPNFCRVKISLTPSVDSNILMEVWLPENWNRKFLGVGSFGWGGSIMYNGLMSGLQEGYAVANSDTGHQDGNDGAFSLGHPEKMIDYGYRAAHEMTVTSKKMIKMYYGKLPKYSYWAGCSLGGLEGLIEAKRYPKDYNGYVIGAPPNPIVHFNGMQIYSSWLLNQNANLKMNRDKMNIVHNAVLDKCASEIGKSQGFVDKPETCDFDPSVLICKNGETENCLSVDEVDFVKKAFRGPVNSLGEIIFPGPAYGTENDINTNLEPMSVASGMFKYFAFQDSNWDFKKINWDTDITKADNLVGNLLHVKPEELKPFLKKGGKILFYLGWNDSHNPTDLLNFTSQLGFNEQIRTFLIPGMGHCASGNGCDTFDKLSSLDNWISKKISPEKIISYKVENETPIRSRPICAYPKKAVYKGVGDISTESSFECVK